MNEKCIRHWPLTLRRHVLCWSLARVGRRRTSRTTGQSRSGRPPAEPDPRPASAVPSVAYVGDRSRASTRSVAATPSPDALVGRGPAVVNGGGPGEGSAAATRAAASDRPATVTLRFRTSRVRAFSATLVFPARARARTQPPPSSGRTSCKPYNHVYTRVRWQNGRKERKYNIHFIRATWCASCDNSNRVW